MIRKIRDALQKEKDASPNAAHTSDLPGNLVNASSSVSGGMSNEQDIIGTIFALLDCRGRDNIQRAADRADSTGHAYRHPGDAVSGSEFHVRKKCCRWAHGPEIDWRKIVNLILRVSFGAWCKVII
jgi:hypothetical protein